MFFVEYRYRNDGCVISVDFSKDNRLVDSFLVGPSFSVVVFLNSFFVVVCFGLFFRCCFFSFCLILLSYTRKHGHRK